jgi:hypothetical protein
MPRYTKKEAEEWAKGNTAQQKYLLARYRGETDETRQKADWSIIDRETLMLFVASALSTGGAVMLGTDKSGFGYTINVFLSGQKIGKWFRPDEIGITGLHEFMEDFIATVQASLDSP